MEPTPRCGSGARRRTLGPRACPSQSIVRRLSQDFDQPRSTVQSELRRRGAAPDCTGPGDGAPTADPRWVMSVKYDVDRTDARTCRALTRCDAVLSLDLLMGIYRLMPAGEMAVWLCARV